MNVRSYLAQVPTRLRFVLAPPTPHKSCSKARLHLDAVGVKLDNVDKTSS
jgi:hypothetical protein